ncbi:lysophospholipid acyltransferase family protein [Sediminitomix flava]|uniref:KDO2-lipid IV(A) lauroyltransferase n=1 Tax=Sediminitomix flava TaxID=379075 RepID=A0A315ZUL4_SEDFL|nr:lysophospholipid acyltransferase family protein [Sediminitomix flava]PWJ39339.1 KDO2-lipid IV(A) lauroyltransferase [Sediminitomix flava]
MGKKKGLKKLKYDLLYAFVKGGVKVLQKMPRKPLLRTGGRLGVLAYKLMKSERLKTLKNLDIAYGDTKSDSEKKWIAKESWRHLGMNAIETFRLPLLNTFKDFNDIVTVTGWEKITKVQLEGSGVIGLCAHHGCFELVNAYAGLIEKGVTVVGAPLKDERLNELLIQNRSHQGQKYVTRSASAFKHLLNGILSKELSILLVDQDTQKVKNVFVDFMGTQASTPIGATILAAKTGAPVFPISITRNEDLSHAIVVGDPVYAVQTGDKEKDLIDNTQRISDSQVHFIKQKPEQWIWLHERWKTRPQEEEKESIKA